MTFARLMTGTALGLALSATTALAETTLTISNWLPPTHHLSEALVELGDMIAEATDGEVVAEVKNGLAPPPAQMDLVMDGAADLTVIFHGYQPGRFTATKLIELPGYTGNAEAASVAYWRVHEAMLADLDEHRGVKVVALHTHGPGQIHSANPVSGLSDLDGLKTRLGGGVSADVGAELGLVGIQVPAPKVYETLASGAADAVAMPAGERIGFKLNEVAKHYYEMPGGFYRGSFAVLMSQEAFDDLPAEVQEALDGNVFGETASRMIGAKWDAADVAARAATEAAEDNTITVASDADQAAFAEMAETVRAKIHAELEAKGLDAAKAAEMLQAEMDAAMTN